MLPRVRLRTELPKARHCEGFSPWQSLVAPGCHSEQSEESPTRLYAVNVLSPVGFEEILEFLFVALPRHSLQAISALGLIATLDYAQCANQAD